jgi:uncharacterized membrane protein YgcG
MKKLIYFVVILGLATLALRAQEEVPPPMPAYQPLSAAQLDQLLGPIALYPDPLISEILPASTLPTQIVLADRYLTSGGDPNAIDQQPWDPSVQALAHYPQVLSWMDNNLNWTTQVGQAFENQQQDVMDSIQRLRLEAYNLGNLQSTPQQQVIDDNGYIEILPASPDDVFVPEYQPDQVYYDQPYGTPFITFSVGYVLGPWLCCDFDWHDHNLVYWDHNHLPPTGWWHERPDWHAGAFAGHTTVWNPGNRPAATGGYSGGDRGWTQPEYRWSTPAVSHPSPAPAAPEHYQQNYQRPADNAFLGIDNDARSTRADSERGQESVREEAPAPRESGGGGGGEVHSAPSGGGGDFHSGGGGGGGGGGGRR